LILASFKNKFYLSEDKFADSMVESLYAGNGYILKRAFPAECLIRFVGRTREYGKLSPSSFYKIHQDCPDFHRVIDRELAKKWSFRTIRHSYYFFPWNNDPLNIFQEVNERRRCLNF